MIQPLDVDRLADVVFPGGDLAGINQEPLVIRVGTEALLDLAIGGPVLRGRQEADGVGSLTPDHGDHDRDVLRAVLAGKLARALQLLLNVVPGHAGIRMDDSGCDDCHAGHLSLDGTQTVSAAANWWPRVVGYCMPSAYLPAFVAGTQVCTAPAALDRFGRA